MAIESLNSDVLQYHFLFAGLTEAERSQLLDQAELREYAAGQVILEEGDANTCLFIVLSGRVEVLKLEPTTSMRLPLATINEGGIFGEMSFLKGVPCSATIKAVGPVTLLALDRRAFGPDASPSLTGLVANLTPTNLDRLSTTNAMYVKSAADYLQALRTQNEFGKFFVIVVVTFGIGNLLNRIVNDYVIDTTSDLFSWAYLVILAGVIQTSLQRFLADARGAQTVLITSFLFGVFHLHISIIFSLIVFAGSMAFGFLYLRTQNLLGVSILHWLPGLASIQAGLM